MNTFWIVLAATTLATVASTFLLLTIRTRRVMKLCQVSTDAVEHWPSISVIVAARNEQRDIEVALLSLLRLDYGDFEVIAIDDRSTDNTGEILDSLARQHDRLRVLHVAELPAGWLGKNHALFCGAEQARGEYLLFTDADVVMDRRALQRAMAFVQHNDVDHLAVSPEADMPTYLLQAFVTFFVILFTIYVRPWKVSDPRSSAHIGIGAFNLVKRDVYQAVGTHRAIAMRPDDDIKLGKIVKSGGFRQQVLSGTTMIRVPWYASVGELVAGMEKNAFSGVDYRIWLVFGSTVILLLTDIWPFFAIFLLEGPAQALYAATLMVLFLHVSLTAMEMKYSFASVPLFPFAVLLMIYIQWRAMLLTFWNNGIRWRDTHYSLAELRANKV